MRKLSIIFFAILFLVAAGPALASNNFLSFDQQIRVGSDSALTVQETINVNLPDQRHGIFRDLPVKYQTPDGDPFNLRVKVVSVSDDSGNSLPYVVSQQNGVEDVRIGDPNVYVTGRQTYILTYTVSRALLYLSDQDQLYWNVIGASWGDLGIPDETSATVILPGNVAAAQLKTSCFTAIGSTTPGGCENKTADNAAQFSVSGTKPLTIVVGWPKGIVAVPAPTQQIKDWLADNWIVFWPLIVFAGMFLLWFKKGRDPKPEGPLVVSYEPPEKATPAELGVLFDERTDAKDITATIIHLAVKGYLNIIESPKKNSLIPSSSYVFELNKLAPQDATLTNYEQGIINGLFGVGASVGDQVDVSSLQNSFYAVANVAKAQMDAAAVARGWFVKSPTAVRAVYMGAGIAYLVLVAFFLYNALVAAFGTSGPVAAVALFLPGAIILFFGYFMPARTLKGTEAYAQALGFKEYLSKAEKYRLKWDEKVNIFEAYLPYAMIFGVVDKWSKAFEGIDKQPPSWYRGGMMNGWSPLLFANTLTNATSTIGRSLAVAPSAKGGGGFGGGGFGGGGFGGGGGGSW